MGSVGRARLHRLRRPRDADLARPARRARAPSVACAGEEPERPTVLAFDLDPGAPATAVECAQVALRAARAVRRPRARVLRQALGIEGDPGLRAAQHRRSPTSARSPIARAVAQALERAEAELVVSKQKKELRKGKVLVDWSQNDYSKTTVAVYSLRCRQRPWVSTPLTWDEVEALADDGDPDSVRFEAPRGRSSGSPSTATCSPRCSSSSRSCPSSRRAGLESCVRRR